MQNISTESAKFSPINITGIGYEKREIRYKYDNYGFLKQIDPKEFKYNLTYKFKQSTNSEMVQLRLGWLQLHLNEDFKNLTVVDIGSGNMRFVDDGKPYFKRIVPFDLDGESITKEELYDTLWDVVCMFDVLEHYKNIDEFFDLKFRYAYISYPEYHNTPLKEWRHYKPDEHIYCLNREGMRKFVDGKAEIIAEGCPEDIIRKRWDNQLNNISSVLLKRI